MMCNLCGRGFFSCSLEYFRAILSNYILSAVVLGLYFFICWPGEQYHVSNSFRLPNFRFMLDAKTGFPS